MSWSFVVMDSSVKLVPRQELRYTSISYCFIPLLSFVILGSGKFISLLKTMDLDK